MNEKAQNGKNEWNDFSHNFFSNESNSTKSSIYSDINKWNKDIFYNFIIFVLLFLLRFWKMIFWSFLSSSSVVSILLQSPVIYVGTPTEDGLCQEYAPEVGVKIFFSAETVSLFLLPLVLMCFCLYHIWKTLANSRRVACKYGWQPGSCQRVNGPALALNRKLWRQRKRGIRVVTTTVLVFAMGYMPIHSVHLWYAYSGKPIREHDVLYVLIHTVANTVMYFSNFMNPYIYAFLGKGFRNHLKNSLLCVHIRKKLRDIADRRKSNSIWL